MITEDQLRRALHGSADTLDPAVGAAETRLRARADRLNRRRTVGLVAAVAAAVVLAIGAPLALRGHGGAPAKPQPATTLRLSTGFPAPVRLSVPAGWSTLADEPGDVRLQPAGASQTVVGIARVRRVMASTGGAVRSVPAPRDLPTWFKTRPDLTVVRTGTVRVGDLFGTRLELRVRQNPSVAGQCSTACLALLDLPAGQVDVPAGETINVAVVNDDGTYLLVYETAPPGESAAGVGALDRVLSGLAIG